MQLDRRGFALTALALGLMTSMPAIAGPDEDSVLKNVETFRVAQARRQGRCDRALAGGRSQLQSFKWFN